MNLCVYANKVNCNECAVTFYRSCEKFRRMHNLHLVKDLLPFKAKDIEIPSKRVVMSRDINTIKSVIAKVCIKENVSVKKLTLNQVLNLVLNKDELELGKVVYIECKQKPLGEMDKVISVLSGFVDSCELRGIKVYIYSALPTIKNQDWYQL